MPEALSLSAALALAGSALALLLAATLWLRAGSRAGGDPAGTAHGRTALRSLAVSFAAAGVVGAAIAVSHNRPGHLAAWLTLEQACALAASAAFLRFAWLVGRGAVPRLLALAITAPPAAGLLAPLLFGAAGQLSDTAMLALQSAYGAAGVWALLSGGATFPGSFVWRRRALASFAVSIHLAQWIRWLRPDVAALRDVVPLTLAAAFVAMAWIALRSTPFELAPPTGRALRPAEGRAVRAPDARVEAACAKLERSMTEERWYLEPGLSAGDLAERLGLAAEELTQAARRAGATGVPEYLARLRVAEARRLLESPRHDQLTVDAIGTRSGFASRSVFFDSFKRLTGMSPAAARRDRGEPADNRPETPSGRPDSENPVGIPANPA